MFLFQAAPHPNVFRAYPFLKVSEWMKTKDKVMIIAEGLKLMNIQCIQGRMFISLEKVFVSKNS